MSSTRVFVSFDYDHDSDLNAMLVGQARSSDSPFEVADWSIKEASPEWKAKARRRIRAVDQVAVVCRQYTHAATGVNVEVRIAQDEKIPYFLLWGRNGRTCRKPTAAKSTEEIYKWTWPNLKKLIGGAR